MVIISTGLNQSAGVQTLEHVLRVVSLPVPWTGGISSQPEGKYVTPSLQYCSTKTSACLRHLANI